MQTKRIVVASIFLLLMITLGAIFRTTPNIPQENALRTLGTIEQVMETQNKNVVFKLKDDDRLYYIQEDLGKDLTFQELQAELSGKSVEIYYVKHWTPIDPLRVTHITKVDLNNMT